MAGAIRADMTNPPGMIHLKLGETIMLVGQTGLETPYIVVDFDAAVVTLAIQHEDDGRPKVARTQEIRMQRMRLFTAK